MMKRSMLISAILIGAALSAPAGAAEIAAGTDHCIAGGTRMMLTLGDMTVSGRSFTFKDPTGGTGTGRYELAGEGFRWSDIGAITADQIVESGREPSNGNFYFRYKARPTSLPTTVACQRI